MSLSYFDCIWKYAGSIVIENSFLSFAIRILVFKMLVFRVCFILILLEIVARYLYLSRFELVSTIGLFVL